MGTLQAVAALLAAVPVFSSPSAEGVAPPQRHEGDVAVAALMEQMEERFRSCGLNCVYMMLSLENLSPDYEELNRCVQIGPKGNNMVELRDAARQFGLDTTVYQCDINDLDQCPTPFIAYMKPVPDRPNGHFIVVLEPSRRMFRVMDGSFPWVGTMTPERFRNEWGGRVLGKTIHERPARTWGISIGGLGCLVLLYACYRKLRQT